MLSFANTDKYGLERHEILQPELSHLTDYEIVPGAHNALAAMGRSAMQAEHSVDAHFFSFEGDEAGKAMAESLMTASANGAQVRVMVDGMVRYNVGDRYVNLPWRSSEARDRINQGRQETKTMFAKMKQEGIELRLPWLIRNHSKLLLIDADTPEQNAWLGGVQPTSHNASWHDFMVKMTSQEVTGNPITALKQHFDAIWSDRKAAGFYDYGGGLVVAESTGVNSIMPLALELIKNADGPVYLESPYVRGGAIWRSLAETAAKGTEVSVVVPKHNHKSFAVPGERIFDVASERGINVYRFNENEGMTHARALVAGRWALFGSHPFNGLQAGKIAELGIITPAPELVDQLRAQLQTDIEASQLHS